MKRTENIQTVRNLLKRYVPVFIPAADSDCGADNVVIYIQDVTDHIDYYILNWNPLSDDFFALTDPLHYDNVLDLENIPLCCLEGNTLFYKVYAENRQIYWKKKYRQLLPLKPGIQSSFNK